MKFSSYKKILHSALQEVIGIVERKSTAPILSHIYMQAIDNELILKTTDTEIAIQKSLPVTVNQPGEITLPAHKLIDLIRNLPEDNEIFFQLEGERMLIKNNQREFYLLTLPACDFPLFERDERAKTVAIKGDIFREALEKVKISMATQDARYFFNGMFLAIVDNGQKLHAVSSDGHRMSFYQYALTGENEELKIIVPRKAILELIKCLAQTEDDIALELSNKELTLRLQSYQITTRLIDANYPDYLNVIPAKQENPIIIDKSNFINALLLARVLLTDKQDGIHLRVEEQNLYLSARNFENETSEDVLEIVNSEQIRLELSLNINYLLEALQMINGDNIQLHFNTDDRPNLVTSNNDEFIQYVIMPMRL